MLWSGWPTIWSLARAKDSSLLPSSSEYLSTLNVDAAGFLATLVNFWLHHVTSHKTEPFIVTDVWISNFVWYSLLLYTLYLTIYAYLIISTNHLILLLHHCECVTLLLHLLSSYIFLLPVSAICFYSLLSPNTNLSINIPNSPPYPLSVTSQYMASRFLFTAHTVNPLFPISPRPRTVCKSQFATTLFFRLHIYTVLYVYTSFSDPLMKLL